MDINLDLLGQLLLPHLIIMGVVTFLAAEQPGKFSTAEIIALALGWLIPLIGPIPAGLFVIISRKRRAKRGT